MPTNTPIDKAKTKSRIVEPPKNNIESKTNKVVNEVLIERVKV